ncbi:hypothetical protein ACVW1D_004420 [Ewingella americana]
MSEPVSATAASAALATVGVFGWFTGLDYGVVFGAFAGAVFYVTSAVDLSAWRRISYFGVSFLCGLFGAGVAGAKLAAWLNYPDKPLGCLGRGDHIRTGGSAFDVRQQPGKEPNITD